MEVAYKGSWFVLILLSACGVWNGPGDRKLQAEESSQQQGVAAPGAVIMTDAAGKTLYYFDMDTKNKSACNNECAQYWPPLRPSPQVAQSPNFTVIKRSDGSEQVAYKGKPLYTYQRDKPGETRGDGQRGVWHVLHID